MAVSPGELVDLYRSQQHLFEQFKNAVVDCFKLEPTLNKAKNPTIHSIKSRLKDPDHLREKLLRKVLDASYIPITHDNFFSCVTDLTGVRVLHLYQDQFPQIHEFIDKKVKSQD